MTEQTYPTTLVSVVSSRRTWLLAVVAATCLGLDLALVALDREQALPYATGAVIYLSILSVPLSLPRIQLPRGYLTLSAIAMNAGSLVLPPRFAAIVGVVAGGSAALLHRRVISVRLIQVVTVATGPITAAAVRPHIGFLVNSWLADGVVLAVATAATLLLTGVIGSILTAEAPSLIIRRNISRHWIGAFVYFAVASLLISHVLDGTTAGYALASLVALLALALSDSVAGRQVRLRLQAQLSDAERVIAYSRVVEGTIHNLRNHLAAASGHLEEIAIPSLGTASSRHVVVAAAALDDAVELLAQLQAGSALARDREWVDLATVASDVCLLLRARADKKRTTLQISASEPGIAVKSDSLLIKQVLSNLVLNAIEAVGSEGVVKLQIGRTGSKTYVTVLDNGPGVPDKYRPRLFEPHFTTKSHGTGVGLYVSYQIATGLGGDLRYQGSPEGAVFTLTLPAD